MTEKGSTGANGAGYTATKVLWWLGFGVITSLVCHRPEAVTAEPEPHGAPAKLGTVLLKHWDLVFKKFWITCRCEVVYVYSTIDFTIKLSPLSVSFFSFDGRVVAKLPFVPLSYIQGLSHRNLLGEDYTDCSFIFLYILCTMSIRQVPPADPGWPKVSGGCFKILGKSSCCHHVKLSAGKHETC